MRAMDLAPSRPLRAADFKNWEFSSGHRMTTEGQNRSMAQLSGPIEWHRMHQRWHHCPKWTPRLEQPSCQVLTIIAPHVQGPLGREMAYPYIESNALLFEIFFCQLMRKSTGPQFNKLSTDRAKLSLTIFQQEDQFKPPNSDLGP